MRKVVSIFVVLGLTAAGYFFGAVRATAASHNVTPSASANSVGEGDTGTKAIGIDVNTNGVPAIDPGDTVTVDVTCIDGTAKRGTGLDDDYSCAPAGSKLTLENDGSTAIPSSIVGIKGDTASESNETFTVRLSNPRCTDPGAGECGTYTLSPSDPFDITLTIVNDDGTLRTISITDATATEGNVTSAGPDHNDLNFTVTLSRLCSIDEKALVLNVATAGSGINPATASADYEQPPATLTFDPGQTTKTLTIKTNGDTVGESTETFTVTLSLGTQPPDGTCANNTSFTEPPSDLRAAGTITDDDGPAGAAIRSACSGKESGDFNGDGRDDLAVGIPGQSVSAKGNAGAVQVHYGSAGVGLVDAGKQLFEQGANNVDGTPDAGDEFGSCLAAGNFNGDGFSDLAIGTPSEDVTSTRGSFSNAGVVNVIYGSSTGLNAGGTPADQIWAQDSPGVLGGSETNDAFGSALAAGDFNGDGRDDLAIGAPLEDIGSAEDAGSVNVLPGGANGLTATADQIWFQKVKKVAGASENEDQFGSALSTGDLDGNGKDDLVVGVPGEAIGTASKAGAIHVFRAGTAGLNRSLDKIWFQGNLGIQDTAEPGDRLGAAVAVGDFDNDGFDDVAAGAPLEDLGSRSDVGGVVVLYSTSGGPSATDNELWAEADGPKNTGATANVSDQFGAALTAGDFNGTGMDDLAIGVPLNDVAALNAGALDVLYGIETGLGSPQHITQSNLLASTGGGEQEDAFGSALTNGDYNGDGRADVAVGVPKEDIGPTTDAGAVNVIFGAATMLSTTGDQFLTQDKDTIQASGSQAGDQYGASVG